MAVKNPLVLYGGDTKELQAGDTLNGAGESQTYALAKTFSVAGAASAPAVSITGAPYSGGTGTTTKPLFLIETSGATSNNWNTSGTMLGVNAPSGFGGNLFHVQLNGADRFKVAIDGSINAASSITTGGSLNASSGSITISSAGFFYWSGRSFLKSPADGDVSFLKSDGTTLGNPIVSKVYYNTGKTIVDAMGSGSPEGVLTASVGSTYRRSDGGAGTSYYVKESGSGSTGWVAK